MSCNNVQGCDDDGNGDDNDNDDDNNNKHDDFFTVMLQNMYLRLIVDSFVIKLEWRMTSINGDWYWADSGYSRLEGRLASTLDIHVT